MTIIFGVKAQKNGVHGAIPAPLMVIDPFDIEVAKTELSKYAEKLKEMLAEAHAFEITDEESNKQAVEMGLQAKKIGKTLTDTGAEKTKLHRFYTSAVRNLTKVHTNITDEIVDVLKGKFRNYSRLQEMTRREEERKAQEAARELQKKINAEAKKKKIEPIPIPIPALPQKQAPTRTEEGSGSMKKVWTWDKESYDFALIPDEYKMIDGPAINKAIKAAVRNIPGIRIFQEDVPVWRG